MSDKFHQIAAADQSKPLVLNVIDNEFYEFEMETIDGMRFRLEAEITLTLSYPEQSSAVDDEADWELQPATTSKYKETWAPSATGNRNGLPYPSQLQSLTIRKSATTTTSEQSNSNRRALPVAKDPTVADDEPVPTSTSASNSKPKTLQPMPYPQPKAAPMPRYQKPYGDMSWNPSGLTNNVKASERYLLVSTVGFIELKIRKDEIVTS